MIDFSQDYFQLFDLAPRFDIELDALDAAYRLVQTRVHPDRFAGAADASRRLAQQASATVNEAYRILRDPVERARYLLSLRTGNDKGDDRFGKDTAMPVDFLTAQLERREAVAEATLAGDVATLEAERVAVRSELEELVKRFGGMFARSAEDTQALLAEVRKMQFLSKLGADIDDSLGTLD